MNFFKDKPTRLFVILSGFFITNVFIAEFIGVKIFSLEETLGFPRFSFTFFGKDDLSFNLTAGVLLWPFVFVLTDVINEYYGKKGVRMLSFLAVAMIIYAFTMFYMGIKLAPASWWRGSQGSIGIEDMDIAFGAVFGQGLWIIIGSIIAFLIGQLLDVIVFNILKRSTGQKMVWLRATGSTLISQLIDSFVVLFIAFKIGAGWDWRLVLAIGLINYIYKFFVAIIATPVIYLAHYLIDLYLGETIAGKMKVEAMN